MRPKKQGSAVTSNYILFLSLMRAFLYQFVELGSSADYV